ncbi:MAG: aldo/keto reductase [Candidatus Dormibacteria bacterium]
MAAPSPAIRLRPLGTSGLEVPPVCIGTYTLAGAWGGDLDAGVAAMKSAVEHGLTFFDTARAYGRVETILAGALREHLDNQREKLVICSKGGFQLVDRPGAETPFMPNSRPEYLRECVEKTLDRLGIDYLDIFLVHWYDPNVPVEEVAGAMGEFVSEGIVRRVGVSNYTVEQMRSFAAVTHLDVAQIPYSLFSRGVEDEVIPFLAANGTGIMGYAALAQGFLSGTFTDTPNFAENDFRSHARDFQGERFAARVAASVRMAEIGRARGCTLPELAIAWVLANPAGIIPLVGAQAPGHITSTLRAAELDLTPDEVASLRSIAQDAPEMDFEALVQ